MEERIQMMEQSTIEKIRIYSILIDRTFKFLHLLGLDEGEIT